MAQACAGGQGRETPSDRSAIAGGSRRWWVTVMATCGMESASMAADRPTRPITGKRAPRRSGSAASKPGTMPPPTSERRFVDIDPWAVLLEQLMEVPEESRATSEPEQGGTNDRPEPR